MRSVGPLRIELEGAFSLKRPGFCCQLEVFYTFFSSVTRPCEGEGEKGNSGVLDPGSSGVCVGDVVD